MRGNYPSVSLRYERTFAPHIGGGMKEEGLFEAKSDK
jgi:hypothetical protein